MELNGSELAPGIVSAIAILVGILQAFSFFSKRQAQKMEQTKASELLTALHQRETQFNDFTLKQEQTLNNLQEKLTQRLHQGQLDSIHTVGLRLQEGFTHLKTQFNDSLTVYGEHQQKSMTLLTQQVDQRLLQISQHVDKRLAEGFEKTTTTFTDIVKRLAVIDEAQKKITELSSNVVSLQSILADKRSRGSFGEVQLSQLIRNMIPEQHISFQHTLSNDKRVDCLLLLPEPTGNIAIDAKFPLETFRKLTEDQPDQHRKQLETQFRQDIKKHIQAIAEKYIIPGETADGAMMFIPAEAIFAEIHGHFPDLIDYAHSQRVWLVSPTTMMAILTTAAAVLKDAQTRKQVHIIQAHLVMLAKDFSRFQTRMDNLAKHIHQANEDVSQVHMSAQKISSRFEKIEAVELHELTAIPLHEKDVVAVE